jgi:hypothetical protein
MDSLFFEILIYFAYLRIGVFDVSTPSAKELQASILSVGVSICSPAPAQTTAILCT